MLFICLLCDLGHLGAIENLLKNLDMGILFTDFKKLNECFGDAERIKKIRENAWKQRFLFSFDQHLPELTHFFHEVIERYKLEVIS